MKTHKGGEEIDTPSAHVCGTWSTQDDQCCSEKWCEVTCKRCLKMKPKRKKK